MNVEKFFERYLFIKRVLRSDWTKYTSADEYTKARYEEEMKKIILPADTDEYMIIINNGNVQAKTNIKDRRKLERANVYFNRLKEIQGEWVNPAEYLCCNICFESEDLIWVQVYPFSWALPTQNSPNIYLKIISLTIVNYKKILQLFSDVYNHYLMISHEPHKPREVTSNHGYDYAHYGQSAIGAYEEFNKPYQFDKDIPRYPLIDTRSLKTHPLSTIAERLSELEMSNGIITALAKELLVKSDASRAYLEHKIAIEEAKIAEANNKVKQLDAALSTLAQLGIDTTNIAEAHMITKAQIRHEVNQINNTLRALRALLP